ncbi:hypothetical protein [Parabacteroides johnsonii]|uniref:hypothetical protein n=1 Tax=Parabacteroides johnsonii TaxID=387661 RepID=UPI0011DCB023|nr:hypothetical protein [Parabacteroides johnsonii]
MKRRAIGNSKYMITIHTMPGAIVTVNVMRQTADNQGYVYYELSNGIYFYQITKLYCISRSGSITVTTNQTFSIVLQEEILYGKAFDEHGNIYDDTGSVITNYLPISNSLKITFKHGFPSRSSGRRTLIEYNSNKTFVDYWNTEYPVIRTVGLTGGYSTRYIRASLNVNVLDDCYIYDDTNNIYLWKGINV